MGKASDDRKERLKKKTPKAAEHEDDREAASARYDGDGNRVSRQRCERNRKLIGILRDSHRSKCTTWKRCRATRVAAITVVFAAMPASIDDPGLAQERPAEFRGEGQASVQSAVPGSKSVNVPPQLGECQRD